MPGRLLQGEERGLKRCDAVELNRLARVCEQAFDHPVIVTQIAMDVNLAVVRHQGQLSGYGQILLGGRGQFQRRQYGAGDADSGCFRPGKTRGGIQRQRANNQ